MQGRGLGWVLAAAVLIGSGTLSALRAEETVLDDFEKIEGWTATASRGTKVELAQDTGRSGFALRIDFDFSGGGHVIVRKAFSLRLPSNYAFRFAIRGQSAVNNFEFKLVDPKGDNVWWSKQRDFSFPSEWQTMVIKKARLEYAWGSAGGGPPRSVGAIELAITAAQGGKGSVWIDELVLEERESDGRPEAPPRSSASTSQAGHDPELVFDSDPTTSWRSGSLAPQQWILIDFVRTREYGGLVIDWDPEDYAIAYEVQTSDDAKTWKPAYTVSAGNGGRDYIYLHDAESRFLRLDLQQSSRGQGYGVRNVEVKPFSFSASPNHFFAAIAADAPPGSYPKYFSDRQTYWTVVGVNGDPSKALVNEEGMIEVDNGSFSLEPFLYSDGELFTWNSARTEVSIENGYLPIPTVTWASNGLRLRVTAFAAGAAGRSSLLIRYEVENLGPSHRDAMLFVAFRPFQVLPPWQSLNVVGGVTPVRSIASDGRRVWVNGSRSVVSLTRADGFGAAAFDEGLLTDFLATGRLPPRWQVNDSFGYASGALEYRLALEPGARREVLLEVPWHDDGKDASGPALGFEAELQRTARQWQDDLSRVELQLPGEEGRQLTRALKTAVAHILINRDGPAIRPGARTYRRSWIRDGAASAAALLTAGFSPEVRQFVEWFAGFQFEDGRIPCCIDERGPDQVPENDSNGAFILTTALYYRFTRDVGFLVQMWPAVSRAVDSIEQMRNERLGKEYDEGERLVLRGLMPESISHEGYSSRPVHSYWDDFFTLRGLDDAAHLAVVVGDDERARHFAALRDAFRSDLLASIQRAMQQHKIDYVPGSVELGDFDPTSTAAAVIYDHAMVKDLGPQLIRTFDAYWDQVEQRARPDAKVEAYSAYELRNVEALVRLRQRERALALLRLVFADRRPPEWNQWQEITWRDPTAPRFIGDMPHTWIGAIFVRSVRALFAHEDNAKQRLVLAAGLAREWVLDETGVTVKRLPTAYGVLNYTLRPDGPDQLRLVMSGDIDMPSGKIVLVPPLPGPIRSVAINGRAAETITSSSVTIGEFPAEVVLQYESAGPVPAAEP